jgi:phosphoribosylanthranilate isomerase
MSPVMPLPRPRLKICGIRLEDQAAAVAALGVDAIGVIAVPGSARWLEPERRPALFAAAASVNPRCRGVLVVADPADGELEVLRPAHGHQVVQLHGGETPRRCAELRRELGCAIWKALRIRSPRDLEDAGTYAAVVDAVLLDAWVPRQLGGSGRRLPLEWLAGFEPGVPWWLAGGLSPETVVEVLNVVRPYGLDASSALERSPGDKDIARVKAMLDAVRGTAMSPISPGP